MSVLGQFCNTCKNCTIVSYNVVRGTYFWRVNNKLPGACAVDGMSPLASRWVSPALLSSSYGLEEGTSEYIFGRKHM